MIATDQVTSPARSPSQIKRIQAVLRLVHCVDRYIDNKRRRHERATEVEAATEGSDGR